MQATKDVPSRTEYEAYKLDKKSNLQLQSVPKPKGPPKEIQYNNVTDIR